MLRDRYFFPLCAVAAIAMIALAMAPPRGASPGKVEPAARVQEPAK